MIPHTFASFSTNYLSTSDGSHMIFDLLIIVLATEISILPAFCP